MEQGGHLPRDLPNPGGGGPADVLGARPDRCASGRLSPRGAQHGDRLPIAPWRSWHRRPGRRTAALRRDGRRDRRRPRREARRGDTAPLPRLGGGVPPQDHPRVQGSPARVLVHDAAGPQGIARAGKRCPRRVDQDVQPAARARQGRRSGGGTDRQEPRRVARPPRPAGVRTGGSPGAHRRSRRTCGPNGCLSTRERRRIMSQVMPERRPPARAERSPFADLDQLGERMRRMLEQTFGDFAPALTEPIGWIPAVDLEEQDDAYVVEAEVPGVKREDVNIELVGNELTITGEIKEKERKGVLRRKTRRVGRFEFRVTLPNQVDPEKIDAKLAEGVLTVRVPKSERAQRRQIEVKGK